MKRRITATMRRLGVDVRRYYPGYSDRCVSLQARGTAQGRVLLAYILDPFLRQAGEVSAAHTHFGESRLIADTFLDLGFDVDVIDYRNDIFQPQKRYNLFVSARTNFESIARSLDPDCIKIAHLYTAQFLFNN